MLDGDAVGDLFYAASPENFSVNPESRKDYVLLHVARAKRLIVIVNDCDGALRCGHPLDRMNRIDRILFRNHSVNFVNSVKEIFEERVIHSAALRVILHREPEWIFL